MSSSILKVNRQQIADFVDAIFRYADDDTFVNLRAVEDKKRSEAAVFGKWKSPQINGSGLEPIIEAAAELADDCAKAPVATVFCPPVCAFRKPGDAAEETVANGLEIMVECDTWPNRM